MDTLNNDKHEATLSPILQQLIDEIPNGGHKTKIVKSFWNLVADPHFRRHRPLPTTFNDLELFINGNAVEYLPNLGQVSVGVLRVALAKLQNAQLRAEANATGAPAMDAIDKARHEAEKADVSERKLRLRALELAVEALAPRLALATDKSAEVVPLAVTFLNFLIGVDPPR